MPISPEGHATYITSDAAAIQYARRGGCPSLTPKVSMRYTRGIPCFHLAREAPGQSGQDRLNLILATCARV